jgi:predicted  nucleic acid-binding Zn-ribbon protein
MPFPIKTCIVCGEEFELKPDKPGFANRCPECTAEEASNSTNDEPMDADERRTVIEMNSARRRVIRDMLYRKEG